MDETGQVVKKVRGVGSRNVLKSPFRSKGRTTVRTRRHPDDEGPERHRYSQWL